MSDAAVVERVLDGETLETGHVRLGPREQERLGLPEHSGDVEISFHDGTLVAQWVARSRVLSGEALCERLQEWAQEGWLLRLERRDGDLRLEIAERGRTSIDMDRRPAPPPDRRPQPRTEPTSRTARRRRKLRDDRFRLKTHAEYRWVGPVGLHQPTSALFTQRIGEAGWDRAELLELRLEGERLAALDNFEELLAVDVAHVDRMPHQENAARTVLAEMRGRGILADEVGLGKTIEAGLVAKELELRGLASSSLILCPVPLRNQWRDELAAKFELQHDVVTSGQDPLLRKGRRLIMSHALAQRNEKWLTGRDWDLLIVDEAHKIAGGAKATRAAVKALVERSRYVLFLTATPVQNELVELYRLVETLRPGTFRSQAEFTRRFVDTTNPRRPVKAAELRKLVKAAMVRTTRSQAGLNRVKRHTVDRPVTLSDDERALYDLCLHALRNLMDEKGDPHRRRILAHRLTASPHSLSTSALRWAEQTTGRKREVLTEIAHLAGDLGRTNRERVAGKQIRDWVREHGRVLVFTQHTDTVTGLLRLLAADGIPAVPFHGGMSAEARGRSVASFQAGDSRVLVSTDAGAEGQNLQVCNCVLNYDLPWNPMRIEQRIGRVDRLTQPRDDVYVANLFARDTVDEYVYRLLYDKLAMFELLFGQVTTILGELDQGDGAATFEGRVLAAVAEADDRSMRRRLDDLGTELEQARRRGDAMIDADSGLSAWMSSAEPLGHREKIGATDATELTPRQVRERTRQRKLAAFVNRLADALGMEATHRTAGFVSLRVPDDLREDFDRREFLHLAFDRTGLDEHPDAELCAVGSEVFEEMLSALRLRGDLHCTVARVPAPCGDPLLPHADNVRLAARLQRWVPSWSGRAWWKVAGGPGGPGGSEEIVEAPVGEPVLRGFPRTALGEGESIPTGFSPPAKLIERLEASAVEKLGPVAAGRAGELTRLRKEDGERLASHFDSQLSEQHAALNWASGEQRRQVQTQIHQLEKARDAQLQALSGSGSVEIGAELLAVDLIADETHEIVEVWTHLPSGIRAEIAYEYWPADPVPRYESDAGGTVAILSMCADGHVIDEGQRRCCPLCGLDGCDACGAKRGAGLCTLCGAAACASCRPGGVCTTCLTPTREEAADDPWRRAWRLGNGVLLVIGARSAELRHPDGTSALVVSAEDATDRTRTLVRAVAVALGLPPDTGARWSGPATVLPSPTDVRWQAVEGHEWSCRPDGGAVVDLPADLLPHMPDVAVGTETDAGLAELLERLRAEDPPPAPPALVVQSFLDVDRVEVSTSGLQRWRERHWASGTIDVRSVDETHFAAAPSGHPAPTRQVPVASADLAGVRATVDGLHGSYVIGIISDDGDRHWFLPGRPAVTCAGEAAWAAEGVSVGVPPDAVITFDGSRREPSEEDFAHPVSARLVRREVADRWKVVPTDRARTSGDRHVDDGDLPLAGLSAVGHDDVLNVPGEIAGGLLDAARAIDRRATGGAALVHHVEVEEEWEGWSRTVRRYVVGPGTPLWPTLDDTGVASADFGVDSRGHLHEPGTLWECPACEDRLSGGAGAPGALADCGTCGQEACGRCRVSGPYQVVQESCGRCGARSCGGCSRTLTTGACAVCERSVCRRCRTDDLCLTCSQLSTLDPVPAEDVAGLPAATGLRALVSSDGRSTVAVLAGSWRTEIVVIEDGRVVRWRTAGTHDPATLRLLLGVQARWGLASDVQLRCGGVRSVQPPVELHLAVTRTESLDVRWRLDDPDGAGIANSTALPEPIGAGTDPEAVGSLVAALDLGSVAIPDPFSHGRSGERSAAVVTALAARVRPAPGGSLVLDPLRRLEAVYLLGDGLRWVLPDDGDGRAAHWSNGLPFPWAAEGWAPTPEVVATATLGGVEAVIARLGRHTHLGLRHGSSVLWCQLRREERDVLGALLADHLGDGGVILDVTACTDPDRITGPVVVDGRFLSRQAVALLVPSTGRATVALAEAALRSWAGDAQPSIPEVGKAVPTGLANQLLDWADRRPERAHRTVGIGAKVEERWQANGREVSLSYELEPWAETGWVTCEATGEGVREVRVDRSGHLVAQVTRCPYCDTDTCTMCERTVAPCLICAIPVCGRCAERTSSAHVCRACTTLRKPGWLERRRHRQGRPKGTQVLEGGDPLHQVLARGSGTDWTIESTAPSGFRTAPQVTPRAAALLEERLLER